MKILVLFDSFFGNTAKIAQAIVEELSQHHEITSERVDVVEPDQLQHLDLIFIGSPTPFFTASPNIIAFLKTIPVQSLAGVNVAVFDTRIAPEDIKPKLLRLVVGLVAYADRKIISLLKHSGAHIILPGVGFLVSENEGPLKDGELARAATWARSIVTNFKANKKIIYI